MTLMEVSIGIVNDTLLFHTKAGIILSTLSMIMILYQSVVGNTNNATDRNANASRLPWLYTISWSLLSFVPFVMPDTSTDYGHMKGTAILNVLFISMAYSARLV